MGLSFSHLLLVLLAVLLVFGAGRLPSIMKDLAKGLRAFKEGIKDDEDKHPLLKDTASKTEKES
ncbi:MAG: twin-arginine translocase TatA/TatE family subunit [Proteobacteria bacterium]|nr:twin-arginine translocase TatA/TatE family subunit [Pseudomonadota bacterium]